MNEKKKDRRPLPSFHLYPSTPREDTSGLRRVCLNESVCARECPFLEAETGSRSKGSVYKSVLERPLALSKGKEKKKKKRD